MTDKTTRKLYSYARFSSDGQREESITRQQDAAQKYADSISDDDGNITFLEADKGVSAFKGGNLKKGKGALGDFVYRLQIGELKGEEVRLVIENVDRFSRLQSKESYKQFVELLDEHKIEVYVTSEDTLYTEDSDIMDRIKLQLMMERAHDESKRKSELNTNDWRVTRIRDIKKGKKFPKLAPSWVRYDEDKDEYYVDDADRKTIQLIFKKALDGLGAGAISTALIKEGVEPLNGAWSKMRVTNLLASEALTGKLQFYKGHGRKATRVPSCEAIENHFPVVIDAETYEAVQSLKNSRTKSFGRPSIENSNLFQGFLICDKCEKTMRTSKRSGVKYCRCAGAVDSRACDNHPINYPRIEKVFFDVWSKHNLIDVVNRGSDSELESKQTVLSNLQHDLVKLEQKERNLSERLALVDDPSMIVGMINESQRHIVGIKERIALAQSDISQLGIKEDLQINCLDELSGDQRGEVNLYLRKIIKEMRVYGRKLAWRDTLLILEVVFRNGQRIFIEDRKGRDPRFLDGDKADKPTDLKLSDFDIEKLKTGNY